VPVAAQEPVAVDHPGDRRGDRDYRGCHQLVRTAREVSTDDAYIPDNSISIAPKISGYVTAPNGNDNTLPYGRAGA
jgi:hypothetical protein